MYSSAIESEDRKQLTDRKHALLSREGVAEGGEAEVRAVMRELAQVERALEQIERAKPAPAQLDTHQS